METYSTMHFLKKKLNTWTHMKTHSSNPMNYQQSPQHHLNVLQNVKTYSNRHEHNWGDNPTSGWWRFVGSLQVEYILGMPKALDSTPSTHSHKKKGKKKKSIERTEESQNHYLCEGRRNSEPWATRGSTSRCQPDISHKSVIIHTRANWKSSWSDDSHFLWLKSNKIRN